MNIVSTFHIMFTMCQSVNVKVIGNNLKSSKKWNIQGSRNGTIVLTN
jgi:hypothetical protein